MALCVKIIFTQSAVHLVVKILLMKERVMEEQELAILAAEEEWLEETLGGEELD